MPGEHDAASRDTTSWPDHVERGMELLRRAAEFAHDVDCDIWQFGVEIPRLREVGMSNCDLRWLLAKKLVRSAREITQAGDEQRRFVNQTGLGLSGDTCFVLGPDATGAELVREAAPVPLLSEPRTAVQPVWDSTLRELRVGSTLVKRFRVPAPNQELILSVFHEEGWTRRIQDPLPQVPNISPKRRLQAAIMCLNRNQRAQVIRFRGNGRGDGVGWEFRAERRRGSHR